MPWDNVSPVTDLVSRLIDFRLRIERVRLAQRLHQLEELAATQGLPREDLRAARYGLKVDSPLPDDWLDRALVLPRKPAGVWQRRYTKVVTRPGSVF
jgi:hypothetical protein